VSSNVIHRLSIVFATLSMCIAVKAETLYINYSNKVNAAELTKHDLSILDPHAKVDLTPAHQAGHRVLAYLSVVELANGSEADAAARAHGVSFVGANDAWRSHIMDVGTQEWRDYVLDDAAKKIVERGFDGFFLDTIDTVETIADGNEKRLKQLHEAVVHLVRELHARWPKQRIIVNRGFATLKALQPILHGVLIEGTYQDFDPETKRYRPVNDEGRAWVEARVREAQALKLPVYAVDYVSPTNKKLARQTADKLRALGCVPLVTTHGLTGVVLAQ
jgi:hypothetical protein